MPSFFLCEQHMHVVHRCAAGKTLVHIFNKKVVNAWALFPSLCVPFLSNSTYILNICTQWGLGEFMRLVDLFSVSRWTSLTKHSGEVARDRHFGYFGPRGENGHQTPSPVLGSAGTQQRESLQVSQREWRRSPGPAWSPCSLFGWTRGQAASLSPSCC